MKKKVWRYDLCTHVYQKWQSYDVWFLRYGAWQTEFFVILGHFLPFYLPNDPENQNFEMKKNLGDIIILNICTINDNHMVYGSWDMEHKKIFCFGPFLTFYPTNNPKNQNFDKTKKKKHLEISSIYISVPKIMIICCTAPEIWRVMDLIFIFHLWLFFVLLHP